jgi:hypothetical protein
MQSSIVEITNLYVKFQNGENVRYNYMDNIPARFRPGDIVEYETISQVGKDNVEFLKFKPDSVRIAGAPTPEEAFKTGTEVKDEQKQGALPTEEQVKDQFPIEVKREMDKSIHMVRESCLKSAVAYHQGKDTPSAGVVQTAKVFEEYVLRKE